MVSLRLDPARGAGLDGLLKISLMDHADPAVASAIHRVLIEAYRVEGDLLGVADFPPLRRTEDHVQAASSRFFGLVEEGTLAAVAEVAPEDGGFNIDSLVVAPAFFRRGLASRLLRHLLEEVFPDRVLSVSTAAANDPAILLYEKLGFRRQKAWRGRGGIPMVRLVRDVTRRQ